ncbi:hypothetical protein GCM10022227_20070 [Streptomyces sedi]
MYTSAASAAYGRLTPPWRPAGDPMAAIGPAGEARATRELRPVKPGLPKPSPAERERSDPFAIRAPFGR